jgi:hypothetical protein
LSARLFSTTSANRGQHRIERFGGQPLSLRAQYTRSPSRGTTPHPVDHLGPRQAIPGAGPGDCAGRITRASALYIGGSPCGCWHDRRKLRANYQQVGRGGFAPSFRRHQFTPRRKVPLGDAAIVRLQKWRAGIFGQLEEVFRGFQLTPNLARWINHWCTPVGVFQHRAAAEKRLPWCCLRFLLGCGPQVTARTECVARGGLESQKRQMAGRRAFSPRSRDVVCRLLR